MSTLKAGPVMFAAVYADCPTPRFRAITWRFSMRQE